MRLNLTYDDIKYYNGKLWIKHDGVWIDASNKWSDKDAMKSVIGAGFKRGLGVLLDKSGNPKGAMAHFNAYITKVYENPVDFKEVLKRRIKFSFRNGYIDKNNNFVETKDIPFTTTQINFDYKPFNMLTPVKAVDDYLDWMTQGNRKRQQSLLAIAGSLLCFQNDGLFGIIYSQGGGAGKTQFFDAVKMISQNTIKRFQAEPVFGHTASGKFALTNTENKTGLIGEELPTTLNKSATDLIKDLADPGKTTRAFENKGQNSGETLNNLTVVVSTNRLTNWYEPDNALKSRVAVVKLKVDKEWGPMFSSDRFKQEILYEDDALGYLLNLMIYNYILAKKEDNYRAEGFKFGLPDTEEYWKQTDIIDGNLIEFADHGLFDFLSAKQTFISNETFSVWYKSWSSANNYTVKISQNVMKKRVKKYIEDNYSATVEIGKVRRVDNKSIRGLYIQGKMFNNKEEANE